MKSMHTLKKAKNRKNRTNRKQKGGAKLKSIDACLVDIPLCFRNHDAIHNDCSLIVVDIISMGSFLSGTNHLFLLFEDIMFNYNISLEKIYAFCDFYALLNCYKEVGGNRSKTFIEKILFDKYTESDRSLAKKSPSFFLELYCKSKHVLDLFLPFLHKIKDNSNFFDTLSLRNINEEIVELFNHFMKASLLKVDTGNLILNLYSHGSIDYTTGNAVLGLNNGVADSGLIDAETLYSIVEKPILTAEKVANFIFVNGACFANTFIKEFVNIPKEDKSREFGNIIALGNTTDVMQLPVWKFLFMKSSTKINAQTPYSEFKELMYKDVKVEQLVDEAAYTSGEFFKYHYSGQTNPNGNHSIYLISLLFEAASKKMETTDEIIKYLRDNMYLKYKELVLSDDEFTQVPFFTKKFYEKHELFSEELKEQLLVTHFIDADAFAEYFNKLN